MTVHRCGARARRPLKWLPVAVCLALGCAAPALSAPVPNRPSALEELARLAIGRPHVLAPSAQWHLQTRGAHSAIVGGTPALQGQLSYLAFIAYFDAAGNPVFTCSGAVVSAQVVMTAGHCAVDETTAAPLDPAGYVVVTGAADWTDTTHRQLSHVTSAQTAPGFDLSTLSDDEAELVLTTPTTAPAIRLANTYDQTLETGGTGAVIAGWGLEQQGGVPPTTLQWASTVVQNPGYCAQFASLYDPATQTCVVNAPTFDTATCNGDSGSPLIAADSSGNPVAIGTTSYGPSDCDTTTANYFTTVRPLFSWAQGIISANTPPPPPPTPKPPTKPPVLPTMIKADARTDADATLAGAFPVAYKHGHSRRLSCSRQAASKFGCNTSFWYGPNDYFGTVNVFYVFGQGDQVFWSDHYVIHWVSDHCYFHTRHPNRCTVHTRKGVY